MKYFIGLTIAGIGWSILASTLWVRGAFLPILVSGVLTAFMAGYAVRRAIRKFAGWRWFLLPLLTVTIASVVFGSLVPCALSLWAMLGQGREGLFDGMWSMGLVAVFYALTLYLPITYPASLATH